nr:MAG TPA: hypothetical protein [Caudoviricetes sp.]
MIEKRQRYGSQEILRQRGARAARRPLLVPHRGGGPRQVHRPSGGEGRGLGHTDAPSGRRGSGAGEADIGAS